MSCEDIRDVRPKLSTFDLNNQILGLSPYIDHFRPKHLKFRIFVLKGDNFELDTPLLECLP